MTDLLGDQSQPEPGTANAPPESEGTPKRLQEEHLRDSQVIVGGRLSCFPHNWRKVTQNKYVLDIVEKGFKLPFETKPALTYSPPYQRLSEAKTAAWEPVVQHMLAMEAIEEVTDPNSGGMYASVFLRPKPNGSARPIINLKPLNAQLRSMTFTMATPQRVLEALQQGVWTTSIDLKDAYFHVPMAKPHRKYLRFAILGRAFQFKTLPFGLAPAPRVFTQLITVLVKWAHSRGIQVIPYLDDWLLYNLDRDLLAHQTAQLTEMAESLGWVINRRKSDLTPSQTFEFLGIQLDTRRGMAKPVPRRVDSMMLMARKLLGETSTSARTLMKVQGTMVSLGDLVKLGKLKRRPFQAAIRHLKIHGKQTGPIPLSQTLKESLKWWTIRANLNREVCFLKNKVTVTIVTDASTVGWGATVADIPIRGRWTGSRKQLHINCLEMLAVERTLQHTPVTLRDKHISLHTDNMTVRAYLRKQGGTVSPNLNKFTGMVWRRLNRLNATLSVKHISGSLNVLADRLSRPGQVLQGEWELNQETFRSLTEAWQKPSIDLFATRFNRKITVFASPCPDQEARGTDAFTMNWSEHDGAYLFPPFRLLIQALEKIRTSRITCMIIAPTWPGNPFFPLLLQMSSDDPISLGNRQDLLAQGLGEDIKTYPNPGELGLHAWIISSKPAKEEDSRRKWRPSPQPPSAHRLCTSTTPYGNFSILGYKPTGEAIHSMPHPQT